MQGLVISKAPDAFRTISEVAEDLDVPQHVLRFWETKFTSIRPLKRGGGRRYYRPDDVDLLKGIRQLLYGQGYTIKGVQRILKEQGVRVVQDVGRSGEAILPLPEAVEFEEDGFVEEPRPSPMRPQSSQPDPAYPMPDPPAFARPAVAGMPAGDVDRLRGVLADLIECQRILASLKRG